MTIKRVPLFLLSTRQRAVLDVISRYTRATGEPCTAGYIARQMRLHHKTVQEHIGALHRKGWLKAPNPPAMPVTDRAPTPRADRGVITRKDRGPAEFAGN